jgi:hypothetical protein
MKRIFCALFVVIVGVCLAAPEPAIVPAPGDWTVNLTFEKPQPIELKVGAAGELQRFWYMIVSLTNNTGRDVEFYPKCELMTDTFEITTAERGVPAVVFERLKRRYEGRYPFLEKLERTNSKMLQGEDSAKDIVIIWRDFDSKAKNISIFIAGLSNETAVISHPIAKDENGNPLNVFLRKTLELKYSLSGDPMFRDDAKLLYKGKRWVMR